jgi:hypothetical protein
MPAPSPVPWRSGTILRVDWVPGADQLLGTCHCGAEHVADNPIDVWTWLLDHPHRGPADPAPPAPAAAREPARERAAV